MKAEVGSMSVDLSPSSRSDASQVQPKKDKKTPPGFRPSFTPNLFSSFEQFDMSLKRIAARADSAHRKRKQLVSIRETSISHHPMKFIHQFANILVGYGWLQTG